MTDNSRNRINRSVAGTNLPAGLDLSAGRSVSNKLQLRLNPAEHDLLHIKSFTTHTDLMYDSRLCRFNFVARVTSSILFATLKPQTNLPKTMRYQRDLSEISPCIRVGQKLINVGLLALIGGGAITKVALGDQLGKGVPPMLWWILIPIWSTIVIGGCLCMAGWIRFPAAAPLLSLPYERDASGRAVSPIIKASMALLSFIMLAI